MIEWSKAIYNSTREPIVNFLLTRGVNANHVTIFNHIITLTFGCFFFWNALWIQGLAICFLNGYLDYLDGDVAKSRKQTSSFGIWIDSGFDVIIQSAIMGAIGMGCYKWGLDIFWLILFFIGNSANNFISFNYNATFGFDSDKGSEVFRKYMERKSHFINRILKNIIDPTDNYPSLMFYTYRYWIALGAIFNIMPLCFMAMTIINNIKWAIMYVVYALYLKGVKRLWVLRALSLLDEEENAFYALRRSK